ncbi:hypothetical protein MPER_03297, partial [Moniliophthora perniciosa FA553]
EPKPQKLVNGRADAILRPVLSNLSLDHTSQKPGITLPGTVYPRDPSFRVLNPCSEGASKVGTTRVFFNESKITALSSLGEKFDSKKGDDKREIIRKSVGRGVKALKALDGLKGVE